jgi:predicted homoserine dehydrogenase-like protein
MSTSIDVKNRLFIRGSPVSFTIPDESAVPGVTRINAIQRGQFKPTRYGFFRKLHLVEMPGRHTASIPALRKLSSRPKPVRIGLIGAGAMGRGLLHQCRLTPGLQCVAVADLLVDRAIAYAETSGLPYKVADTIARVNDAIRGGFTAICEDGALVAGCEGVEVLVESSSAIGPAGGYAVRAVQTGKHVVMMNAEADLIFGPYLMALAHRRGLVYTSCDGDQHGVISRLVNDLELWGFELIMAGNIKGFLDRYSDPTKIVPEADKRGLDYKMATAYTDGTKLNIEMALVANALNLRTRTSGMTGPAAANVRDVFRLFDFRSIRAEGSPCVDYILGAEPGGGVFAIGFCDHAYQVSMMEYYKMGPGPFYLFYRPYHLCHVEAMDCIIQAVVDGWSLLEPCCGFRTNVFAYAKRDLKAGEKLDGIGGYACYGLIENYNHGHPGLPICLAEDVVLRRDIGRDSPVLLDDVELPVSRSDFDFYRCALEASDALP